jgi:DNA-directed RNA polymerase specialized sigma24 family protein
VVVLADVEGLKYGEIAEALDLPIGTVRSRMEFESRLKERLSALSTDDVPSTTRDRVRELIRKF